MAIRFPHHTISGLSRMVRASSSTSLPEGALRRDPIAEVVVAGRTDGLHLAFGYGRNAANSVLPLLGCISERGRIVSVAGDKHAAAAMYGLSARDRRLEVRRASLRDLVQVVPKDVRLDGAIVMLGMAALPQHAASWLMTVQPHELAEVFQAHAEQEDPLLWARVAEAICMNRRGLSHDLQTNGEIMELIKASICKLGDPAGPPAWMAMDAIRSHLRGEGQELTQGVMGLLESMDVGARCALLLSPCDSSFVGWRSATVAPWRPGHVRRSSHYTHFFGMGPSRIGACRR